MYPCFEELVVHLQETRQLHSDLLHGGGDEAHVPVESAHLLLQILHQELCKSHDTDAYQHCKLSRMLIGEENTLCL